MIKRPALLYGCLAGAAALLLILASFWDLEISHALCHPENLFARFMEAYGGLPAYCIPPFAAAILFAWQYKTSSRQFKAGILALLFILGIAGWLILLTELLGFPQHTALLISVLCTICGVFAAIRIPQDTLEKLRRFASFALAVLLLTLVTVSLLKTFWGRARFRTMLADGDFSSFSFWFLPQGITGHQSFPSGHTASASSVFVLAALGDFFPKLQKKELLFFWIAFLYTGAVALSRMIAGAHFLSDVTVGAVIGILFFALIRRAFRQAEQEKREYAQVDSADSSCS
ncbi:MAG TPA: phosphatase PAP2 family protein [Firmicutes bacterium]|nr:phosphatase PAP2 family protein [Bacillota bacterium]